MFSRDIAKYYDLITTSDYYPYRQVAAEIAGILGRNARVLELGVGTGNLALELANFCEVYGIDNSRHMIDVAKKKDTGKKLRLYVKDASNFHFEERFDAVVCYGGPAIFFLAGGKMNGVTYMSQESTERMFRLAHDHLVGSGLLLVHAQVEGNLEYPRKLGRYTHDAYNKFSRNKQKLSRVHVIKLGGKTLVKEPMNINVMEPGELDEMILSAGFERDRETEYFHVYRSV